MWRGMPAQTPADDVVRTSHRIIEGDSRDLSRIGTDGVDLVVTSPPYPMVGMWDGLFSRLNPGIGSSLSREDGAGAFSLMHAELDRTWKEVHRVLRPGGFACVNVGDAVRSVGGVFELFPNHLRVMDSFRSLGFTPLPYVLWSKPTNKPSKYMGSGMLPAGAYATLEHEFILVFRKGGARRFPPDEAARRRRSAFFWEERNAWFSDRWTGIVGARQGSHPPGSSSRTAAFPVDIPLRLILMYSLAGDTVLDPFLGAGTTMLAAVLTGRSSIGYEIDPDAAHRARTRVGGAAAPALEHARKRLTVHQEYVAEMARKGRRFQHTSSVYGFPVMTRQEIEMAVPELQRLVPLPDGTFEAEHVLPLPGRRKAPLAASRQVSLTDFPLERLPRAGRGP